MSEYLVCPCTLSVTTGCKKIRRESSCHADKSEIALVHGSNEQSLEGRSAMQNLTAAKAPRRLSGQPVIPHRQTHGVGHGVRDDGVCQRLVEKETVIAGIIAAKRSVQQRGRLAAMADNDRAFLTSAGEPRVGTPGGAEGSNTMSLLTIPTTMGRRASFSAEKKIGDVRILPSRPSARIAMGRNELHAGKARLQSSAILLSGSLTEITRKPQSRIEEIQSL